MSAELVLAVAGLVDGSIKLVRKITTICRAYRNADEEINEKYVLVESAWTKIEMQLRFLRKISDQLTDDLVQSQLNLLQTLEGKLTQTVSRLGTVSPDNVTSKGKTTDIFRKSKFALVKKSLNELTGELEAWLQRFDPTWFLMILVSSNVLDVALSKSSKRSNPSNPLSRMLSIRSIVNQNTEEQGNIHVTLAHDGLKDAQEYAVPFTTARVVTRAGSSNLLIVERVNCPPGSASQVKTDVTHLARTLQNVDPDSFGLLRCKGILKHRDAANKLSAIEILYRTPPDCQPPQTLRHHLLKQNPVSLSAIIRMAKQLVRSVHYVHACGFVHKNVRPENLVVFPGGDGASLGQGFLVGFTEFRNANFQTNLHGDAAWHRNLYRHPQRQGALVRERYVMQHDIYSLGVCLLEIGLWQSFVWYPTDDGDSVPVPGMALGFTCSDRDFGAVGFTGQRQIQEQLVALAKTRLPSRLGDIYTDIVVACMTCLDPDNETFGMKDGMADEDGIIIGVKFVEHILSTILKISL